MAWLYAIFMEIKINLERQFSYKVGIISDILVIGGLYICLILTGSGNDIGRYYGIPKSSKSLLLVGYVFWSFTVMIINNVSNTISFESQRGTLEQKLTSIIPFYILLIGDFLADIVIEIIELTIIISILCLKVHLIIDSKIILVLMITLIGMYGIALIFGGITIKEKKIGQLMFIVQTLLLFISDTITIVSDKIKIVEYIPITVGNNIARLIVSGKEVPLVNYFWLVTISIGWLIIGIFIFNHFKKLSKKNGFLSSY